MEHNRLVMTPFRNLIFLHKFKVLDAAFTMLIRSFMKTCSVVHVTIKRIKENGLPTAIHFRSFEDNNIVTNIVRILKTY